MARHSRSTEFLNVNNHPVCGVNVASRHFLDAAATPPGQEGRWPAITRRSPNLDSTLQTL